MIDGDDKPLWLVAVNMMPDEAEFLRGTEGVRCGECSHLKALHNEHCCFYCNVGDCPCSGFEAPV